MGTVHHISLGVYEESGDRKRNVGMYRMQVYDERTTGMHWQTQKHGRNISGERERRIPKAGFP